MWFQEHNYGIIVYVYVYMWCVCVCMCVYVCMCVCVCRTWKDQQEKTEARKLEELERLKVGVA